MTRALRGLAALTLLATAPLAAQYGPVADRMLGLQGRERPDDGSPCRLSGGGPNVTGASTRLQSALSNGIDANKRRMLGEGRDLSLQSVQGSQAGSTKAWYYLARTYLQLGDLAGADSAFTHLVGLAPACRGEAMLYRLRAWSILMSAAGALRTANHVDSAVYFARQANLIEASRPQSWYTIGAALLEEQKNDSAVYYLGRALAAPADSSANAIAIRQAAAYQIAVIDYNKHDFPAAVRHFAIALQLKSDDSDARRNLAASLRQAGMADSAAKVEATMMAAAAGSEAGLTVGQLFDIGVAQYNANKFDEAAGTFEKILASEPFNRDALFNLTQAHNANTRHADSVLSAAQRVLTRTPRDTAAQRIRTETTPILAAAGERLLAAALKLQAIDPLSFSALQLVGAGYRAKHDQAKMLETATALGGATVDVQVTAFAATPTGATLTLRAHGREGRDINDRVVRAAAIPIVFEFLDKDGTVVGTAEAVVPALAKDATQDIPVTGTGTGITAWRYRRK